MSVKDLGDGRFQVRVYNPYGREYRKIVRGKRAADAHEAQMKTRYARGGFVDPHAGKVTFRDYALRAIASRNLAPNTLRRYMHDAERLLFPLWGSRPIQSLRHTDAVALATFCERNAAASSAFTAQVLARSIMRAAVLDGLVDRNPFLGERLGKVSTRPQPTPTWEDVRVIHGLASARTGALIAALAGSGLRAGELCGLTVDNVDFLRRSLVVEEQVQWMPEKAAAAAGFTCGGFYLTDVKTDAGGGRTVPLADWVVEAFSVLAGQRPGPQSLPVGAPDASEMVEVDLLLGLLDPAVLSSRISSFSGRHGHRFAPHGLRRLAATTWEQGGVPLRTVQSMLGHAPQGVTLQRYVGVTPESLDAARVVMAEAWKGSDPAGGDLGSITPAGSLKEA